MVNIRITRQCIFAAALAAVVATLGQNVVGQDSLLKQAPAGGSAPTAAAAIVPKSLAPPIAAAPSEPLFDFQTADIKFSLNSLMKTLRDSKHEGWVLAAYPDPKTSRPLIGAGFSLDVEETRHIQTDPLNPRQFLEPSSSQLWQAAGLNQAQLQNILGEFDRNLKAWNKKGYRKKVKTHSLTPQLSEEEAIQLLRVSTIQAIHNARAYCRNFDQLTASQQMALSQLVFQMGVNLEEFVQFLAAINGDPVMQDTASSDASTIIEADHWKTVQLTLIESQWARRYTTRASSVIAMFDPDYIEDPRRAERRVQVAIHPPAKHHRKKQRRESVRAENETSHNGKTLD